VKRHRIRDPQHCSRVELFKKRDGAVEDRGNRYRYPYYEVYCDTHDEDTPSSTVFGFFLLYTDCVPFELHDNAVLL
jgi:hypothetical protein